MFSKSKKHPYFFIMSVSVLAISGIMSESPATSEAVFRKNKGTSSSGYSMRKLTLCLMGLVADYKGRVRDTNERVIWNLYGNDGYDPKLMCRTSLRLMTNTETDIMKKYGCFFDLENIMSMCNSSTKKYWNIIFNQKKGASPDRLWFDELNHIEGVRRKGGKKGVTVITDQTVQFERYMTREAYSEWLIIKTQSETLESLCSEVSDLIRYRSDIFTYFSKCHTKSKKINIIRSPLSFPHMLQRCKNIIKVNNRVSIHPLIYREFTVQLWEKLVDQKLVAPTNICLKALFFDYLSTRSLMMTWHFELEHLYWLSEEIVRILSKSVVQNGESVGVMATQNCGEPISQMTLKTPHLSGTFRSVAGGTTRLKKLIDGNYDSSEMSIVLKSSVKTEKEALIFGLSLVRCYIQDLLFDFPTYELKHTACVVNIKLDKHKCISRIISIRSIVKHLCNTGKFNYGMFTIPFMDEVEEEDYYTMNIRVNYNSVIWESIVGFKGDESRKRRRDTIASNIVWNICHNIIVHGISEVEDFVTKQVEINTSNGKVNRWCICTLGSNFKYVMRLSKVDTKRTTTSNVPEMCSVLGVHAARKALENEFINILSGKTDVRHIQLICRMMASDLVIKSLKIHQTAQNVPPFQRASYERCIDQLVNSCSNAEVDYGKTICGASLMNKTIQIGTGYQMDLIDWSHSDGGGGGDSIPSLSTKVSTSTVPQDSICSYVYSPKADGTRYYMVFGKTYDGKPFVTLSNRNNDVYELSVGPRGIEDRFMNGTILDGELVDINSESHFLIFDCLMSCGNKCSVLRYDQRIEIAKAVCDTMSVGHQPFVMPKSTVPTLYQVKAYKVSLPCLLVVKPIYNMLDPVGTSPFETDGHVLTNVSKVCTPFRSDPDICFKLKPEGSHTIDFTVRKRVFKDDGVKPIQSYFSHGFIHVVGAMIHSS